MSRVADLTGLRPKAAHRRDAASGPVIAQPCRRHRHQVFLRFLKLIDTAVPKDLELHLVLDNYATRKTPAIHQWLRHPRFHLHFTPASSSWMNLAERWVGAGQSGADVGRWASR